MRSLQAKLSTGLILSLIAMFCVLWLLINFSIQYLADDYIASRLRHDAEMLLTSIHFESDGTIIQDKAAIDLVYNKPYSGHYYSIASNEQVLSSRSLWDQHLIGSGVQVGEVIRSYQDGPDKQSLLVLNNGFEKQGHRLAITVAEDLNPVKKNIRQFQTIFALSAVVLLLLLVVVQSLILRHSLKSLVCLRAELQALQNGETDQLNTDTPSELQPLVAEVNHLLKTMSKRLQRSRDALGDLAHALKKPLTVIRQLTHKNHTAIPVEVKATLDKQTTEINRLTERILKRARLAGHHYSGMRFSFSRDLSDLIDTLNLMYSEKHITTRVHMKDEIHYKIDREDMLELLGNLLDNAYKWAQHRVNISIDDESGLNICIEDDGPGADEEKIQQLDKRGTRLDETKQGYGLGLAIVSDMISDYNGSMTFARSEKLAGFRVTVTLPGDGR